MRALRGVTLGEGGSPGLGKPGQKASAVLTSNASLAERERLLGLRVLVPAVRRVTAFYSREHPGRSARRSCSPCSPCSPCSAASTASPTWGRVPHSVPTFPPLGSGTHSFLLEMTDGHSAPKWRRLFRWHPD